MVKRGNDGRHLPMTAGFGWIFVALLLLSCQHANGCATAGGANAGVEVKASEGDRRLPFLSSRNRSAGSVDSEPTVVGYTDYRDPLSGINRVVFSFNDVTYRYLLIPAAKGYVRAVPGPVRKSIDNFFYNLKTPVYAVNHLLQLNPGAGGRNLLRFGVNSTLGLLGIFNPARAWFEMEREETNFEDTVAKYRGGYGIYLVLPLFGPSDVRNTISIVADHFLNPLTYLAQNPERTLIEGIDFFQAYAPTADRYNIIREKSEDPYIFFRNLYLQGVQRDADY